jgi:hypothetical protein
MPHCMEGKERPKVPSLYHQYRVPITLALYSAHPRPNIPSGPMGPPNGYLHSVDHGLEYWNGVLEWSTGVESWTGVLDWSAVGGHAWIKHLVESWL